MRKEAILFACLLLTSATSEPIRPLPVRTFVTVDYKAPADTWRTGDITARFSGCHGRTHDARLVFSTARAAANFPVECVGLTPISFAIGPLSYGRLGVVVQSYSGGAHCCTDVVAIERHGSRLRRIMIASIDGTPVSWPRDLDGNGTPDFMLRDDSFNYKFASDAGSYPPPRIVSIRDGAALDVSARRAFRPLFAADPIKVRKACLSDKLDNAARAPLTRQMPHASVASRKSGRRC